MLARTRTAFAVLLTALASLQSCGHSPPADRAIAEIDRAIHAARPDLFDAGAASAEVTGVKLGPWEKPDVVRTSGIPDSFHSKWTASLRFKEPVALIVVQIDGTKVVRVVAETGDAITFQGNVAATPFEQGWQVHAYPEIGMDAGSWKPLVDKAGPITMGYRVYPSDGAGVAGRGTTFKPLSTLKPYAIEGSPEEKALVAAFEERQRKQQEAARAAAEKRRAEAEQRQREAQAAAAEKQRLAMEELQRQRAEAAEKQRLAHEEATRKAAAERHARLLTVLAPFRAERGVGLSADAGITMGTLLLDAKIDAEKLAVTGRALELREMPFREVPFEGAVDERGVLTLKTSSGGTATPFVLAGDRLSSRTGLTIAALSDDERARSDTVAELGKRLAGVAPATIEFETLDTAAAKTREPQLKLHALSGTVLYRDRASPAIAPLFAAEVASRRAYSWRAGETIALRTDGSLQCRGIYIAGGNAASSDLEITVNGVHRASIAAIPRLGGVLLRWPQPIAILDLRLRTSGRVVARTIGALE